jgi:UPF0755 protein
VAARAKWVAAAGLALVLLAGGAGAWFHRSLWGVRSTAVVALEIERGRSAREILDQLHDEGLIPSPLAAQFYVRARARARSMHFGRYRFPIGSRPVDVLESILEGKVETFELTVIEGSDAAAIADLFVGAGVGTAEEWARVIADPSWVASTIPGAPSLEGFLFPDTYRFAVGVEARFAARHLVDRFLTVWEDERAAAPPLWGTPLEVVTLASLVEAETSLATERAEIAGVFVNRLRRGMLLQCDPTVVYALKRRGEWRDRLLRVHWAVDDPYNTYRYPGLPPGPINSPGRAALRAAAAPAATTHLYFVARPEGGHTFSATLADHNRAVARLRASRR